MNRINIKTNSVETKNTEIKVSIKFSEISPGDLFILSYIIISQLNAKILKTVEKLKKGELVVGELKFQVPAEENLSMNISLCSESNQLTISCKHKEKDKVEDLIYNIANEISSAIKNFSKLDEENKENFRKIFKVIKEIDRTILTISYQKNIEELYFSLSLLRERTCNHKDLIEMSIRTGQWLNILNTLRKSRNAKLGSETAKKLLSDLLYWKKELCKNLKMIRGNNSG